MRPASAGSQRSRRLPLTEKDELRASRTAERPIGGHLAAPMAEVVRIYSTSGTTGAPSYIPLTAADLADWIEISCRSYAASGVAAGERLVSTYGAGPVRRGGDARRLRGARALPHPGRRRATPSG